MRRKFNVEAMQKAIDLLGGRAEFSKAVGVTYLTVSDWANDKKSPCLESCLKIEEITEGKVTLKDLVYVN